MSLLPLVVNAFLVASSFSGFDDVSSGHRYADAIEYVADQGYVEGYDNDEYRPENKINRAEFLKIVMAATGNDSGGSNCFADVRNEWFAPYVCAAKSEGIVEGYPDNTFRPAQTINVAESAALIARAYGENIQSGGSTWYIPYINALDEHNAMPPTATSVTSPLTRGEMAYIIWKMEDGRVSEEEEEDENDDLDISIDAPEEADAGETITYEIDIENNGDEDLDDLEIIAELDSDMEFVSASDDGEEDDDEVEWEIDLDEDDNITLEITVRLDSDLDEGDTVRLSIEAEGVSDSETTDIDDEFSSSSSSSSSSSNSSSSSSSNSSSSSSNTTQTLTANLQNFSIEVTMNGQTPVSARAWNGNDWSVTYKNLSAAGAAAGSPVTLSAGTNSHIHTFTIPPVGSQPTTYVALFGEPDRTCVRNICQNEPEWRPSVSVPEGWGINSRVPGSWTRDIPQVHLDLLDDIGFTSMRVAIPNTNKNSQGQYKLFVDNGMDNRLAKLHSIGIRPMLMFLTQKTYQQGGTPISPVTPEQLADNKLYVTAVVQRYAQQYDPVWELWNEPNSDFWKPEANVQQYLAWANQTTDVIREIDPDAVIIGPGLAQIDMDWLEELFKQDYLLNIDAVSIHTYRWRGRPPESADAELDRLRALIAQYAPPHKKNMPIIITEEGYSKYQPAIDPAVTDAQNTYVPRQFLFNAIKGMPITSAYEWMDGPGTIAKDTYGMLTYGTGSVAPQPKPAYYTTRMLIDELTGLKPIHRIATANDNQWKVLFGNGSTYKIAEWTLTTLPTVRTPSGAELANVRRLGAIQYTATLPVRTGLPGTLVVTVRNPESQNATIALAIANQTATVNLLPNEERRVVIRIGANQRRDLGITTVPMTATWNGTQVQGMPSVELTRTDRLSVTTLPYANRTDIRIENAGGAVFNGTLVFTPTGGQQRTFSVQIAANELQKTFSITPAIRDTDFTVEVLDTNGAAVIKTARRRHVRLPILDTDGNGDTMLYQRTGSQGTEVEIPTISASNAPTPSVLQVPYTFSVDTGTQIRILPEFAYTIPNNTRAIKFWINPVSGNDLAFMRYTDGATQIDAKVGPHKLIWKGWRQITTKIDPASGPLNWSALFQISDVSIVESHSGEVQFAPLMELEYTPVDGQASDTTFE